MFFCCAILLIIILPTTYRIFKVSDNYDLEQMADTFDVEYHYVENLTEPYIKYQTAFGMKEFDYYLDKSEMPDEFDKFKILETKED